MTLLAGRVAVVTGSGRGLGRAHALALAAHGADVVVNDPAAPDTPGGLAPAHAVVAEIEATGGRAVANLDSCADWGAAEALVAQAVDTFGSLDVLVNNAGILRDKMSFNMDEAEWDDVVQVHLKGHFAPSRFAAAHWRALGKAGAPVYGRIINTSSESGFIGLVGQANYAAVKAGIIGLTLAMARELERLGVTVNAIAPRARTRMTTGAFAGYREPVPGTFDDRAPENISPVVVWLAGAAAGTISGKVFSCYGGEVELQSPIQTQVRLSVGERSWTPDELADRQDEFFQAGQVPGVLPLRAGIGG